MTAYILAGMGELACSKILPLADLCACLSVSLIRRSPSVGSGCGSLPAAGCGVWGSKAGGNWCLKGLVHGTPDQQILLKNISAAQSIPCSSLVKELVIAKDYLYMVGLPVPDIVSAPGYVKVCDGLLW